MRLCEVFMCAHFLKYNVYFVAWRIIFCEAHINSSVGLYNNLNISIRLW